MQNKFGIPIQKFIEWSALITAVALICSGCAQSGLAEVRQEITNRVGDYQIEQMTGVAEPYVPEAVSTDRYIYGTLGEEEQTVYDQMLYAIENFQSECALSTTDVDLVDRVYQYVMADHGDLFWQSGYTYNTYSVSGRVRRIDFTPKYTMTQEEKEEYAAQMEEQIPYFLAGMTDDSNDFEKSEIIYENLIQMVDYDAAAENNQNVLSVFLGKATVCQGYACAVNVLMDRVGIQSCIVTGTAANEKHAWNLIRLDGQYYYMDVTWGNSTYSNPDKTKGKHIDYAFLNFDSEDMAIDRVAQVSYALPDCLATADNYYHHEGLYFDEPDREGIGQAITAGYSGIGHTATIRLSDQEVFDEVKKDLIGNGSIKDYCRGMKSCSYLTDDSRYILTFFFNDESADSAD